MTVATQATRRRGGRSKGRLMRAVCLGSLLVAGACTANSEEVRPPADELFFPTGIGVAPDESVLFAISANSELRYDSGTVLAFDLGAVDAAIDAWLTGGSVPDGCSRNLDFPESIDCPESELVLAEAGVRIGNFATHMAIQDKGGGDLRLLVPVRGDPSVTYIDWVAGAGDLVCGESDASLPLCSEAHRLTRFLDDPALPAVSEEPYDVYVDSGGEWGMVTHLTSGTVTLVDLPVDGAPVLADAITGLFASNGFGQRGSVAVAGRNPGQPDTIAYVTSLSENRVQTFTVARLNDGLPNLVPSEYFFLDVGPVYAGESGNTRGVAFSGDGTRGYFMNRFPPTLTVVDTSAGAGGYPVNRELGATDICREGSSIAVGDVGAGERVFVSCFQDGELHVIDPAGQVTLEAITPVGRGPFSVAVAPDRRRLYISNFFDNTIAVVDLTPGAPTEYRVVLRIGIPTEQ